MKRFEIKNKLIEKMESLGYRPFAEHALSVSFTKEEYEKKYFYFELYVGVPEYKGDDFYYWKVEHGFPGAVDEYEIPITKEEQDILDEIENDLSSAED